ncbi:MAG: aldo/keto reductase [Thermoplasmata archaeon]|nr:aldo/keto reductase [Thermoplasmata archaeon]
MERIAGFATADGTLRLRGRAESAQRVSPHHFRTTKGGLALSSLGLGTYLGKPDPPTDTAVEQAVSISLSSGRVNVVDTAINYRYQRAERSIGRALHRLVEAGTVRRDELFLATKVGYLAPDGEAGLSPSEWVERELIEPGVLRPEDIVGGSHAMTPRFLADQIERSRTNLGVETLDLIYLHNAAEAQLAEVGAEEFHRRLVEGFRELERQRAAGALQAYGIATWDAFRARPDDPSFLALEAVVSAAREVGGAEHGFRFIQFPFNLAMPEAAALRLQPVAGQRRSLFEAAEALGVGCFTSVPLMQGRLARVAAVEGAGSAAIRALQFARAGPGTLAPLVGQKSPAHLSENLAVAGLEPWDRATFDAAIR